MCIFVLLVVLCSFVNIMVVLFLPYIVGETDFVMVDKIDSGFFF